MRNYSRILHIDIETYSSYDISKVGVYRYVEAPDFQVLMIAYAFDEDEPVVVDLTESELPSNVTTALFDSSVLKMAHNANFERVCLTKYLKLEYFLEPREWKCTAVIARELGLPGSLAGVSTAIGLSEDKQKDKDGRALIRYFSVPCKPTKVNGGRTRNLPEHDRDKWTRFLEYCKQDVVTEMAVYIKLSNYSIIDTEWEYYWLDQKINDAGVPIDRLLTTRAMEIDESIKAELLHRAIELTGMENPNSVSQIKAWVQRETGIVVESLNKKDIPVLREQCGDGLISEFLDIREGLSASASKKYEAISRCACDDDRVRGTLLFYGASRTGRFAGRLVQTQNLKRITLSDDDLDIARQIVRLGDLDSFCALFSDSSDVLGQLVRTAIIAEPGNKLVVADFSAIEARVIAWLADEKWRQDVFATHGKIYEASYEQMFNLPPGTIKKGDPRRQTGKVAELALGFAGGVGALKAMGAVDMGIPENELQGIVDAWRAANQKICDLWYKSERAFKEAMRIGKSFEFGAGKIRYRKEGPIIRCRLPSGRELSYVKPSLKDGRLQFWGEAAVAGSGGWAQIDTFSGRLTENIIQAIARDCLCVALDRIDRAGYKIVFSVHDEIVIEVPSWQAEQALGDMYKAMSAPIDWAPGLILGGDGGISDYYCK